MSQEHTDSGTRPGPVFGEPGQPLHALDRRGLHFEIHGLIDRDSASWEYPGVLRSIELAGRYLTGDWTPPREPEGRQAAMRAIRVSRGAWLEFVGRTGALALHAVSPLTPTPHRERLLAWLDMWAESPFAARPTALRWGVARTELDCARDERGATLAVAQEYHGRRRFVELRTGEADPPRLGPVEELTEAPPHGWGTPAQLRRLVACAAAHGPLTPDPEAVALLADGTGVGRAAAALLLLGQRPWGKARDVVDARSRSLLGLRVPEVSDGMAELATVSARQFVDVLSAAMPEDPAVLWEPHGMRLLAQRVADAWCERHGRRFAAAPTTWSRFVGTGLALPAAELCATLAEPHDATVLTEDVDTRITVSEGSVRLDRDRAAWRFTEVLACMPRLVRIAYHDLPAGDPVRDGVPTAVGLLRERLSNPLLLLEAGSIPDGRLNTVEALREVFGGEPSPLADTLEVDAVDDGLTIAVPDNLYPRLFFRPARFGDDDRSRLLGRTARLGDDRLRTVEWLYGEVCAQMVARMRPGTLPPGSYEANPRASVPELVTAVAEHLALPEDAAAYYLQLLALPHPTDRDVRRWNGWRPARLRTAAAALVDAGLAVTDRRARAGRTTLLPGAWATAAPRTTAMEVWKAELLGCALSPDRHQVTEAADRNRPLPGLFATAWDRVAAGDGPR